MLSTFNIEVQMKALPSGYHTSNPPNSRIFCDYEHCNIKQNENQSNDCVLICGHAYHYECFQKLDFRCQYCLEYFINGLQELSNSYNERLENTSASILEDDLNEDDLNEDDLNVEVNENEVDHVSFSDFGNDLSIDRSLDQKLNMAIYNFHHF